jgi:hypothetical protein
LRHLKKGIYLWNGNIQEAKEAYWYVKKSFELYPDNEIIKEKFLEMRYERGEMYSKKKVILMETNK